MVRKLIYSTFFFLSAINLCHGQNYTLQFLGSDKTLDIVEEFQPLQQRVTDSLEVISQTNKLLASLYSRGYLRAETTRANFSNNVFRVGVNAGEQYYWAYLQQGSVPEVLLSKIGYRERFYINKPFKFGELARLFNKIVRQSENTGYPFASVKLDSITVVNNTIQSVLNYTSGPLITYDSLIIKGTDKVKIKWLMSYLEMRPGEVFNQGVLDKIASRINKLGFIELAAPVEVTFQNSQATVMLTLKNINANRIDGVVGILPNAQNDGKLLVTGQFDLSLTNLFNSGKRLDVEWQRLKPLSQFLHIAYRHPNMLASPLHLNTSYELLKEDSTFINRNAFIGFDYQISASNVTFFTRLKTSRLLSTEGLEDILSLPEVNDFNLNYYGIGYGANSFNEQVNRRSGMSTYIEIAVGTKKIRKNVSLPSEIYDGIELNTVQYQLEGHYQYYLPISKLLVFHQRVKGGKIINDQLFKNDLFRLGGLRSLRGFNENFFFASDYLLSNVELQLHFDENSSLFVFYDQSYMYFDLGENSMIDYPLGIGAGISFATKAGIVSLVYAVGKSENQELSTRLSKFHFGYIAKF
ncbi:BamA/TamA family outer membrane protein [Fulvivirga ulvae]|uniref:BamA/TamA family outer membrane protein n=1 Tax=Fulvivirga ulvae TaxID=2904245 RepID=UPI001F3ED387|nr:BamA/TamA family outer membrane protein [Fulvivirga ulvae]UII34222.1 BamA/TamA family outer membrane protein [Fulvivirga ulvae]